MGITLPLLSWSLRPKTCLFEYRCMNLSWKRLLTYTQFSRWPGNHISQSISQRCHWWAHTGVAPDTIQSLLLLCTMPRQYTNLGKITHTDHGPLSKSCHSRANMCRPRHRVGAWASKATAPNVLLMAPDPWTNVILYFLCKKKQSENKRWI